MNVEQLMTKVVWTCTAGDSLREAARIMWERDCGCVPVVESDGSGRVVGIVTDRDICMAAYLEGRPLDDLLVGDAMARVLRTCRPGDSLGEAEGLMRAAHVRRLPVVDDAGHLLGVLSLADIARAAGLAAERGVRRLDLALDGVGHTLSHVVQPNGRA
jgi:CBS domain-containing protein